MTLVDSKGKRAKYMAVVFMGVLTPALLFTSAANSQKTNAICSNAATASSGCIAYEHADFRGRSQALGPNRIFNYVGASSAFGTELLLRSKSRLALPLGSADSASLARSYCLLVSTAFNHVSKLAGDYNLAYYCKDHQKAMRADFSSRRSG